MPASCAWSGPASCRRTGGLTAGGYAELALARLESVHDVPQALDADQAVAMIGTDRTAMAILELAAPRAEDVVVITAAAGGIGTLLIQAAHAVGATIIGAAGGEQKVSVVKDLGAANAVDYLQPQWADAVRGALGDRPVTLALDGVGGKIGRDTLELLSAGGRLAAPAGGNESARPGGPGRHMGRWSSRTQRHGRSSPTSTPG